MTPPIYYQVVFMPTNASSFECEWAHTRDNFTDAAELFAELLSEILSKEVQPPKSLDSHYTFQNDSITAWISKITIPNTTAHETIVKN